MVYLAIATLFSFFALLTMEINNHMFISFINLVKSQMPRLLYDNGFPGLVSPNYKNLDE